MNIYLSYSGGMNIHNIPTNDFGYENHSANQRLDSVRHTRHFKIRMLAVQSSSESPNPKVLQALRSKSKI